MTNFEKIEKIYKKFKNKKRLYPFFWNTISLGGELGIRSAILLMQN